MKKRPAALLAILVMLLVALPFMPLAGAALSDGYYLIRPDWSVGAINGNTEPLVLTCEPGETITIPDEPVLDGRVFVCWQGSEYYPGDRYVVTGDHTFKAQWDDVPGTSDRSAVLPWAVTFNAFLGAILASVFMVRRRKES
ncbi:MAG: InlB B-repeat-containing protein [Lachnospiraceae bacterium]|nr:InlB B-repeat-containing protein [Lachnospiraceae bacterium]